MPIVGIAVLALDIFTIIHVLRHSRPMWWILCILLFPLLGSVFYFLYEVVPGSREQRSVLKFGSDIAKAIAPDKELQRRAAEMEVCGSIANRVSFAAECTERGMFDEAIRIYRGAREGQYQNAPDLLLGLARAYYFNNQPNEARATLAELRSHHPDYYRQEVAILSARAADAGGDRAAALAELESLLSHSVGLEARYRYAEILWRDGQQSRAKTELERVLDHAKRFKVNDAEREWAKLSRKALAAIG
ncbi:tetratricopeptide repeat protein [Dongia sp.]|uniref:tetratricopeptide repeat protein n=1 Tax=Dongia sp. TaxID=1977262 RepID=UPI003750A4CE